MTHVTAVFWPLTDIKSGSIPDEAKVFLAELANATETKIKVATAAQLSGEDPIEGQKVVVHLAFLPGAILAFEKAVRDGLEDTVDNFARFVSEYFSSFLDFRKRWIGGSDVKSTPKLNLNAMRLTPAKTLNPVINALAPEKHETTPLLSTDAERFCAPLLPLLDRLVPDTFRHNNEDVITGLRTLKLPRHVVQQTYQNIMGRDATNAQIILLQGLPTIDRLRASLDASKKDPKQVGLSDRDIQTSYNVFLGRAPSPQEMERVKNTHPDITSLRQVFLKSSEFSAQYKNIAGAQPTANVQQSTPATPFKNITKFQPAKEDRVVFLHIPKCGGTTLHNMLSYWFGQSNVHSERLNGLYGHTGASLASAKVFSGHYDHYATTLIPGPKKMITFLRDPLDRLVSLYNFHRAHSPSIIERHNLVLPRWANEHDVDSYFEHPVIRNSPAINNTMVRYFSDVPQIGRYHETGAAKEISLDEMLEQALRNLEKFAFVGFMDQYAADMKRLAATLGCEPPSKVKKHQVLDDLMDSSPDMRKITKQKPTAQSRDDMEELVAYDRILYAHARELLK
ncbi:sulfotransferase family protein [Octadecabacter sp. B2R22]|uniref:sulfotransferase family 2 domain-containing protein n=1 Tax=Octadecabacter sp. B2R22 TaxID=2841570 RepID=UPI001C07FEC4|nr:sulfotransferase family 2 domain-containing protein [Octadecabacter sp. B2R22]MBU2994093.1 sulfotransferase family protein [Octadecabacter sp. B2R22]